jgi:hypothetical protein
MTKRTKGPQPRPGKFVQPKPAESGSDTQLYPIFSLRYIEKDYCLSLCQREEKAAFADTLHEISQRTWGEIRQIGRKQGGGHEIIARNAMRCSIPRHITEDVNFIAFRFYDRARMVGYKDGALFYIVWLDRSYLLYDHG